MGGIVEFYEQVDWLDRIIWIIYVTHGIAHTTILKSIDMLAALFTRKQYDTREPWIELM